MNLGIKVNSSADMCIMVDHWGENYSLCDIGPIPLGDGIVDVQDMIVLVDPVLRHSVDQIPAGDWLKGCSR